MMQSEDNTQFIEQLRSIVGSGRVLTKPNSTLRYRRGFRFGYGPALAVVRPGSLVEHWRGLKACIASNKIIIMQAATTGLTGGSTFDGNYVLFGLHVSAAVPRRQSRGG